VSDRLRDALEARREAFAPGDLLRMLSAVTELEPRFRKSAQQQLLLEALLVRFALLDRTVSLEAMLRGLGGGGGASGAPSDDEPGARRPAAASPASSSRRSDAPASVGRAVVRDADRPPAPMPPPSVVASPSVPSVPPPDVSRVAERWEDLVVALRSAGKGVCATALEHASPVTVTARGDLTIALDEANPIYEQAIEAAKVEVANVLRQWFGGVQRVAVRPAVAAAAPPTRLTDEMVRSERLSALRRRDPVLGAAIDALDLDLAD
jgi:DNA polymerase-3 subunit gamma/tau